MFPSTFGRLIGIDITSGERGEMRGAGGESFPVYFHNIQVIVGGKRTSVRAGFCDSLPVCILGQADFFDKYSVKFDKRKQEVTLNKYAGSKSGKKKKKS